MGKKKTIKIVSKCVCSTCEQKATVEPNSPHFYCRGIKPSILAQLPLAFKDMTNPTKKGKWIPISAE